MSSGYPKVDKEGVVGKQRYNTTQVTPKTRVMLLNNSTDFFLLLISRFSILDLLMYKNKNDTTVKGKIINDKGVSSNIFNILSLPEFDISLLFFNRYYIPF